MSYKVESLVVKEGKASDQVVQAIESGLDQVLRVMTQKLKNGELGQTSVLQLVELEFLKVVLSNGVFARFKVSKEAIVVDGSNEEENLQPSKGRDRREGSNTVGYIGKLETRSNLSGETVDFLDDISDNCQLGNTSVLELSGTVEIEGFLVNVFGQAKRI